MEQGSSIETVVIGSQPLPLWEHTLVSCIPEVTADPRYSGTGGSRQHRADARIHDDEEELKGEAYVHKTRKKGAGPNRRQIARVSAVINGHLVVGKKA